MIESTNLIEIVVKPSPSASDPGCWVATATRRGPDGEPGAIGLACVGKTPGWALVKLAELIADRGWGEGDATPGRSTEVIDGLSARLDVSLARVRARKAAESGRSSPRPCCRHPDARACLMMRAEPGEENDPAPGLVCPCPCHSAPA